MENTGNGITTEVVMQWVAGDWWTNRQTDSQSDRQTDRQTVIQWQRQRQKQEREPSAGNTRRQRQRRKQRTLKDGKRFFCLRQFMKIDAGNNKKRKGGNKFPSLTQLCLLPY